MKLTPIESATLFEDSVYLGSNPENADMGNPDGSYYGKMLFVMATLPSGRRMIHREFKFELDDVDAGEKIVDKIIARGVINEDCWVDTYSIYGSTYWAAEDRERQFAWDSNPAASGTVRDY